VCECLCARVCECVCTCMCVWVCLCACVLCLYQSSSRNKGSVLSPTCRMSHAHKKQQMLWAPLRPSRCAMRSCSTPYFFPAKFSATKPVWSWCSIWAHARVHKTTARSRTSSNLGWGRQCRCLQHRTGAEPPSRPPWGESFSSMRSFNLYNLLCTNPPPSLLKSSRRNWTVGDESGTSLRKGKCFEISVPHAPYRHSFSFVRQNASIPNVA
jgi:hypothetical protein